MSEGGTSFEPRITLRPRSQDEIFDLALAYLRAFARDYRRPILVAVLVSALPAILVHLLWAWEVGPLLALVMITAGISERSITLFAGRHVFGNEAGTWSAWRSTLRSIVFGSTTVVLGALPALMIAGSDFDEDWSVGGVMLGMVWPFLLASHLHLSEVRHLEQLGLAKAGQRARALVSYRFSRALGLIVTGTIVRVLFVLGTYSAALFILVIVFQFKGVGDTFGPAFVVLGYALASPFLSLVRFFDYIDARTRREGWDIQVRFNAIAQKDRLSRKSRLAA